MFFGQGDGGKTQTAATLIQYLVPPVIGGFAHITTVIYKDSGTAHTLTFLRPTGRTKASATGAASQAVVNFTADPGVTSGFLANPPYSSTALTGSNAIAANDYCAIREVDGVTRLYKVSSVATLAITMTANLTAGVDTKSDIWFFGITTDTDLRSGSAHPALLGGSGSSSVTWADTVNGVISTLGADEPIMFNSNNATNAGTLVQISWGYTKG